MKRLKETYVARGKLFGQGVRVRDLNIGIPVGDTVPDILRVIGRRSDIDPYGATNPAEFFAVVTEMFFEKPRAMKQRHAALYEELAAFYKQDPASR